VNDPRYEIYIGKFGAYFYDHLSGESLTLDAVLRLLNEHETTRIKAEQASLRAAMDVPDVEKRP